MAETLEQVPLVCTEEIAKAIHRELTCGGRVKADELVAIGAANWQRHRIVEHLNEKLQETQKLLAAMDESAKKFSKNGHADEILTLRCNLRGRLEGQVDLLKPLIE